MQQYKDLLTKIMEHGTIRTDRTGTGTKSLFGEQMKFDLQDGFPLVTIKKTSITNIMHELIWFLRGDTNIKYLTDNNVNIWNEWANEYGELGPVYGSQWRNWPSNETDTRISPICFDEEPVFMETKGFDQIINVLTDLRDNPYSRRHIVSAWNVGQLEDMALEPCHTMFQFYVRDNINPEEPPYLDCQLYQRSADMFLGVPYNIASYATLTMLFANILQYNYGVFTHTFGDAHIYSNHFKQVHQITKLEPKPLSNLELTFTEKVKNIQPDMFDYLTINDFTLTNYTSHPFVKGEISI